MDTIGYVPTACQNNSTGVVMWAVWREGRCDGVGYVERGQVCWCGLCEEREGVMVWAVWREGRCVGVGCVERGKV